MDIVGRQGKQLDCKHEIPTLSRAPCSRRWKLVMPLFEIETDGHIIITWASDDAEARSMAADAYPSENIKRLTKRPRNSWVISKAVLGITNEADTNICGVARDCLQRSSGDKVHAIRLYMHETGTDLDRARVAIETNMLMGW